MKRKRANMPRKLITKNACLEAFLGIFKSVATSLVLLTVSIFIASLHLAFNGFANGQTDAVPSIRFSDDHPLKVGHGLRSNLPLAVFLKLPSVLPGRALPDNEFQTNKRMPARGHHSFIRFAEQFVVHLPPTSSSTQRPAPQGRFARRSGGRCFRRAVEGCGSRASTSPFDYRPRTARGPPLRVLARS